MSRFGSVNGGTLGTMNRQSSPPKGASQGSASTRNAGPTVIDATDPCFAAALLEALDTVPLLEQTARILHELGRLDPFLARGGVELDCLCAELQAYLRNARGEG